MEFIGTNTGKTIIINKATFKEAADLKKEALKCLQSNTDSDLINKIQKGGIGSIDALIDVLISADTSESFEKALFKCLARCVYDNVFVINEQLFDDKPEVIEDYYEIVTHCVEENLRPFFRSLITEFSTRFKNLTIETPEQKSEQMNIE